MKTIEIKCTLCDSQTATVHRVQYAGVKGWQVECNGCSFFGRFDKVRDNAISFFCPSHTIESMQKQISELLAKNAQLEAELAAVDEALARRPALEKYKTRYQKIYAACTAASRADKMIVNEQVSV